MTDNALATVAFAFALVAPVMIWSLASPGPDSWCGNAGLVAEVVVTVVVAAILTRYAAIPAMHWLSVQLP